MDLDNFPRIASTDNARIKRLVTLRDKARIRRKEGTFLAEGARLYKDTPLANMRAMYCTEAFLSEGDVVVQEKTRSLLEKGIPCVIVTDEILRHLSDTKTPQGVIFEAAVPIYTKEEVLTGRAIVSGDDATAPLLLFLEDLQDPGNLGTIFRTAEAAGVTGIIMSANTVDVTNPKTVRATMSSIFRVPFFYTDDFPALVEETARTMNVYAAYLSGSICYTDCIYIEGTALLIGNEGNGLSEEVAAKATKCITIPMAGEIESLNAAMAAGILMYEAARQRRGKEI